MKKTLARTALLAAVAATAVATPAVAAPADGGSANARCAAGEMGPFGPFPSKTACITFLNTGKLTGTAYVAQCRLLSAEMGGYPITFYGQFTANNAGQCLNILRSFPHMAPPEGPAA